MRTSGRWCRRGSGGLLRVGRASAPVLQKAWVPKPETGRSSSWPQAERT